MSGDLVATSGTLAAAIAALAVALVRTRDKVTRLEEWVRLHEQRQRERDDGEA
jgi:hypothetical protein